MNGEKPEDVARDFYEAFARRDSQRMAAIYADNVKFSDPVFPDLRGRDAKAMWQMLCSRAPDLKVEYEVIKVDGHSVTVRWEAFYCFSTTGRRVHNIVHAILDIQGGRIHQHADRFSFWRWSAQALGPVGILFGWTGFLRAKVRAQGKNSLEKFISR